MSNDVEMSMDEKIRAGQLVPFSYWISEHIRDYADMMREAKVNRIEVSYSPLERCHQISGVSYCHIPNSPTSFDYTLVLQRVRLGTIPENLYVITIPYDVLNATGFSTRQDTFIGLREVCEKAVEACERLAQDTESMRSWLHQF